MIIAGHALCEGLTVVTDNIRHFENIPNIKVENWIQR
jgi:tRNA(fMet)-specific endonuclease VapC